MLVLIHRAVKHFLPGPLIVLANSSTVSTHCYKETAAGSSMELMKRVLCYGSFISLIHPQVRRWTFIFPTLVAQFGNPVLPRCKASWKMCLSFFFMKFNAFLLSRNSVKSLFFSSIMEEVNLQQKNSDSPDGGIMSNR